MTQDDTKAIEEMDENYTKWLVGKDPASPAVKEQETSRAMVKANRKGGVTALTPDMSKMVKDLWVKYRDDLPPAPDGTKTPNAESTWK